MDLELVFFNMTCDEQHCEYCNHGKKEAKFFLWKKREVDENI